MSGFLGMRGSGSWATDQRPKNWREMVLRLYPNGTAPLTAIMSKLASEATDDPEFNWWTKTLPTQRATVTGRYTDAALTTPYASGGVTGDIIYMKMSAADVAQFRTGHQVLLRDASNYAVDVNAKVVAVSNNGASSYIACKLLEADDNGGANDLSDCDVAIIIGNINEEGAAIPGAISYDPVKYYNYTQIFRTPLKITRTAKKQRLRTGNAYQEMKREALELHSIEMERAFLFGIKTENTGVNGEPERTTQGIISFLRENNPTNVNDFTLNATYSGKAWTDAGGGDDWLDACLEQVFRYGSGERLVLAGSGALLGLNKLAKQGSHYTLDSKTKAYGINVTEWVTPTGRLNILTHPLFSMEETLRYSMLILEPAKNLKYRYVDDTQFYGEGEAKQASKGNNANRVDATVEEYLTEAGLEIAHGYSMMFLNGVGQDNAV